VIVLSDERGDILSFSRQSLVGALPMFVHRSFAGAQDTKIYPQYQAALGTPRNQGLRPFPGVPDAFVEESIGNTKEDLIVVPNALNKVFLWTLCTT